MNSGAHVSSYNAFTADIIVKNYLQSVLSGGVNDFYSSPTVSPASGFTPSDKNRWRSEGVQVPDAKS